MSESATPTPAPGLDPNHPLGRPSKPFGGAIEDRQRDLLYVELRSAPSAHQAFEHAWMLVSSALEQVLSEMRAVLALHQKDGTLTEEIDALESSAQSGRFAQLVDRPTFLALRWDRGSSPVALERYLGPVDDSGEPCPLNDARNHIELRINGMLMARRAVDGRDDVGLLGTAPSPLQRSPGWKPSTQLLMAVALHGEVDRLDKMLGLIHGFTGAAHETLQRMRLEHHHRLAASGDLNPRLSEQVTRELIERLTTK